MSYQGLGNAVLTCPNDHQNTEGLEWCDVCGLPLIDYETELGLLLEALGDMERHVRFETEKVFVGVGGQGCRLLFDFYRSWGSALRSSAFLMMESSGESEQLVSSDDELSASREPTSPDLSLHLLPAAASRQVGYFGLGERLASSDPNLDDRLHRSGIRALTKNQMAFLISALGGGTGSGASPYTLERVKSLNPHCRSVVIAVMPSADEPDSAHFNAFCSLSRFVNLERGPLADMVLLLDHERFMRIRGVGSAGEEVAREAIMSYMLGMLVGTVAEEGHSHSDPGYLAKMSHSLGIHAFVPCMAIGRSLEIFGGLANILESAISCPLAQLDRASVVLAYALVQVPERLATSLREETIRTELNRWNRENFPALEESVLQLSQTAGRSDRIDVCLLLGGTRLKVTADIAKKGFDRFKTVARRRSWEQEFGISSKSVLEIEKAVAAYDGQLDDMAR